MRCFESAARLDPTSPGGWSNLGMMLKIEGRFDESIAAFDRAVACAGDDPQIKINRAITLLHAGRWDDGWRDYEWRLHRPGYAALSNAKLLPSLAAESRLDGQRVLVWHEE